MGIFERSYNEDYKVSHKTLGTADKNEDFEILVVTVKYYREKNIEVPQIYKIKTFIKGYPAKK